MFCCPPRARRRLHAGGAEGRAVCNPGAPPQVPVGLQPRHGVAEKVGRRAGAGRRSHRAMQACLHCVFVPRHLVTRPALRCAPGECPDLCSDAVIVLTAERACRVLVALTSDAAQRLLIFPSPPAEAYRSWRAAGSRVKQSFRKQKLPASSLEWHVGTSQGSTPIARTPSHGQQASDT